MHCNKVSFQHCGYHTIGVIYDIVEVAISYTKIGVIDTSVSYITPHFYSKELLDCLHNDLENNAWRLKHNAKKILEILNTIMQRIMSVIILEGCIIVIPLNTQAIIQYPCTV